MTTFFLACMALVMFVTDILTSPITENILLGVILCAVLATAATAMLTHVRARKTCDKADETDRLLRDEIKQHITPNRMNPLLRNMTIPETDTHVTGMEFCPQCNAKHGELHGVTCIFPYKPEARPRTQWP